jgi:hypothetical protein
MRLLAHNEVNARGLDVLGRVDGSAIGYPKRVQTFVKQRKEEAGAGKSCPQSCPQNVALTEADLIPIGITTRFSGFPSSSSEIAFNRDSSVKHYSLQGE